MNIVHLVVVKNSFYILESGRTIRNRLISVLFWGQNLGLNRGGGGPLVEYSTNFFFIFETFPLTSCNIILETFFFLDPDQNNTADPQL